MEALLGADIEVYVDCDVVTDGRMNKLVPFLGAVMQAGNIRAALLGAVGPRLLE